MMTLLLFPTSILPITGNVDKINVTYMAIKYRNINIKKDYIDLFCILNNQKNV